MAFDYQLLFLYVLECKVYIVDSFCYGSHIFMWYPPWEF